MDTVPALVGIAGHVKGEVYPLEYGKKVIVGRSRSADWSLVNLKAWTGKSKKEQEADHAFRTVSGKHFEITMYNLGSIEVINLSSNGTRLDGKPVERTTVTDISTNNHEIAFGADEVLRLQMGTDLPEEAPEEPAAAEAPAGDGEKEAETAATEEKPAEDQPASEGAGEKKED